MSDCLSVTYILLELVLEPGEVEVQVALLHELRVPASELSNDTSRHMLHKLILTVQKVEERLPDITFTLVAEDLHSGLVLLKCKSSKTLLCYWYIV